MSNEFYELSHKAVNQLIETNNDANHWFNKYSKQVKQTIFYRNIFLYSLALNFSMWFYIIVIYMGKKL